MEDGGIGGLIFYIILGIIALAGSFKGKSKKPQVPPKQVLQRMPEEETMTPPERTAPAPARRLRHGRHRHHSSSESHSICPWTLPWRENMRISWLKDSAKRAQAVNPWPELSVVRALSARLWRPHLPGKAQ